MKWSQHTSDLQEGNAVVCCIPANRRPSSAAASGGAKPQLPPRKRLGVWQHTMAAISHLQRKKQIIPQRTLHRFIIYLTIYFSAIARFDDVTTWVVSGSVCDSAVQPADREAKAVQTASALLGSPSRSAPARGLVSRFCRRGRGSVSRQSNENQTRSLHQTTCCNHEISVKAEDVYAKLLELD